MIFNKWDRNSLNISLMVQKSQDPSQFLLNRSLRLLTWTKKVLQVCITETQVRPSFKNEWIKTCLNKLDGRPLPTLKWKWMSFLLDRNNNKIRGLQQIFISRIWVQTHSKELLKPKECAWNSRLPKWYRGTNNWKNRSWDKLLPTWIGTNLHRFNKDRIKESRLTSILMRYQWIRIHSDRWPSLTALNPVQYQQLNSSFIIRTRWIW